MASLLFIRSSPTEGALAGHWHHSQSPRSTAFNQTSLPIKGVLSCEFLGFACSGITLVHAKVRHMRTRANLVGISVGTVHASFCLFNTFLGRFMPLQRGPLCISLGGGKRCDGHHRREGSNPNVVPRRYSGRVTSPRLCTGLNPAEATHTSMRFQDAVISKAY